MGAPSWPLERHGGQERCFKKKIVIHRRGAQSGAVAYLGDSMVTIPVSYPEKCNFHWRSIKI